ncbi:MAG: hypothetical protein WBD97_20380, partial [Pseudolabrys sp.]
GYEPQLVASDTIGGWVVWAIMGHPAETGQESTLARRLGTMIAHSFLIGGKRLAIKRQCKREVRIFYRD